MVSRLSLDVNLVVRKFTFLQIFNAFRRHCTDRHSGCTSRGLGVGTRRPSADSDSESEPEPELDPFLRPLRKLESK